MLRTNHQEADFLCEAVRNGIIHGGVPQMLGSWTVRENINAPKVFVDMNPDGTIILYVGSLANRLLDAIEHIAQNSHLIKDRPGEGLNKYAPTQKAVNNKVNDAEISVDALLTKLKADGGSDGT